MSKHTPGPWARYGLIVRAEDGGEDEICKISEWDAKNEFANGDLIAAAPDLLDALKWHVDALEMDAVEFYEKHGFPMYEVMPRTRATIAKAEGANQP